LRKIAENCDHNIDPCFANFFDMKKVAIYNIQPEHCRATEKSEAIDTCKVIPINNGGGQEKNNWKKEGQRGGEAQTSRCPPPNVTRNVEKEWFIPFTKVTQSLMSKAMSMIFSA
jgi:hypothetical protein